MRSRSAAAAACATSVCCWPPGARPRRLSVPGADLDGVLHLRDVADSEALAERCGRAGRVVVVGAGWIGTGVAASSARLGPGRPARDPASRELIAFWISDDRAFAGMDLDVWDVTEAIQRLIRDRMLVEDRHLADPAIPIDELIATPRAG